MMKLQKFEVLSIRSATDCGTLDGKESFFFFGIAIKIANSFLKLIFFFFNFKAIPCTTIYYQRQHHNQVD